LKKNSQRSKSPVKQSFQIASNRIEIIKNKHQPTLNMIKNDKNKHESMNDSIPDKSFKKNILNKFND